MRDTIPAGYDGVIIGASIHMGKHDKHVVEFVSKNQDALARLRSAFFSVSLAAHGDTEEAEGTSISSRSRRGGVRTKVALFGGALLYTQYGFIKRHMMKKIARRQAGQPRHRHLTRLRLHRVGRCEALRRGLRKGSRLKSRRPAGGAPK